MKQINKEYNVDEFWLGFSRKNGSQTGNLNIDFVCDNIGYDMNITGFSNHSGFDDLSLVETCVHYIYNNGNNGGLNDIPCDRQHYWFACAQNYTSNVNPKKFEGTVFSEITSIQECILNEVSPFLTVSNINVQTKFSQDINSQANISNETCFESLTAIMSVEAVFDNEFGCEIQYNSEYGIEMNLPMYEIHHDLYFRYNNT